MMFDTAVAGAHKVAVPLRIEAQTWFDARAYASRIFLQDAMSTRCQASQSGYRADIELAWKGDDYSGQRRLWARTRDKGGRWRQWVLA
jgi:hypothetical protein